jgi:hypothetical protein
MTLFRVMYTQRIVVIVFRCDWRLRSMYPMARADVSFPSIRLILALLILFARFSERAFPSMLRKKVKSQEANVVWHCIETHDIRCCLIWSASKMLGISMSCSFSIVWLVTMLDVLLVKDKYESG